MSYLLQSLSLVLIRINSLQKMNLKHPILLTLLLSVVLFTIISCGSDEENSNVQVTSDQNPVLHKEELLGTWDVVSINGLTPDAFFESPDGEDIEEQEVKEIEFYYVFSLDDSWTINLVIETISTFPDIGPDLEVVAKEGKMSIIGIWSGTYSIENSVLLITTREATVNIVAVPPDLIEKQTEGNLTLEEAELQYIEEFSKIILTPFKQSTGGLKADNLTLITTPAKKMVLEKR